MVFLDFILVLIIFIFLYTRKEISLLNPTFLFLMFHFFFVSIRAFQILLLDENIIINFWYSEYVSIDEIVNALIVSDLTLLGFFLGFNLLKSKFVKNGINNVILYEDYIENNSTKINSFITMATLFGIFGTLSFAVLPGQTKDLGETEGSIFISFLTNLGVTSALLLIYEKGFKKIYLVYLILILTIFSIQGYHRYRVILPLLFLMGYYLKIHNLKLPPLKYVFIGIIVLIFSFPLKQIGKSIQQKEQINLLEIGQKSVNDIIEGESGDLSFIEQSAAMIGSIEKKEKLFYGESYIPVMFFWVPRTLWKDKPKLNQWQHDISTKGRDYGQMGQVSLLSGESYANFGYLGAFIVPFLLGRFFSFVYFSFKDVNIKHGGFLFLLLLNMILFQVWRDGVISLIVFPIVNYLPILILILLKKAKR
ncbi:MAG: O-antigen polysaccharide polymerase Wzy [Flavobacteriales bacterium]|nr:O-antigen polysaccharide polymerase Wzy [Flavobacteriales bacterium]